MSLTTQPFNGKLLIFSNSVILKSEICIFLADLSQAQVELGDISCCLREPIEAYYQGLN